MPIERVDFKQLRSALHFATVLAHYAPNIKQKGGDQWHGFCPLPTHVSKGTKPASPSFSAQVGKGIFNCFGCGATGNVLEFIVRMENLDPNDPKQFRDGALIAKHRFTPGLNGADTGSKEVKAEKASPAAAPAATEDEQPAKEAKPPSPDLPIVVNEPLSFTLQTDLGHPYLRGRGFSDEVIELFGLGYANKGIMQGRIAVPLVSNEGQLIGYAGRIVDDAKIDDEHPKYKFPGERARDGKIYAFKKTYFLYNAHRIFSGTPLDVLTLVEGFPSVWWMTQHGLPQVVAVMGSSISNEQTAQIVAMTTRDARITVISDDDAAGNRLAQSIYEQVGTRRFIRWARLSDGKQPTDLSGEELHELYHLE